METILVTRFKRKGEVTECGVFLVDNYCLGVKNAFLTMVPGDKYPDFVAQLFNSGEKLELAPCDARKWVEDVVKYALVLGFSPNKDYKMAARVFGGMEDRPGTDQLFKIMNFDYQRILNFPC